MIDDNNEISIEKSTKKDHKKGLTKIFKYQSKISDKKKDSSRLQLKTSKYQSRNLQKKRSQ